MKFKGWYGETDDVQTFVSKSLDGNNCGRSAVEAATATANNTVEAFARLIDILVDLKVLDRDAIHFIVKGFVDKESGK